MRIAIVSDIHGNRTAFEAVLADLRQTSPDLVFHGGDLADAGSSPVDVVDRIRDLGWPGVMGNGEEGLSMPETLEEFVGKSTAPPMLWVAVREMLAATRAALGEERLAWLRGLPRVQVHERMALVHASPESPWRAPVPEASDAELESVYSPLSTPVAVYGHIHRSFARSISGMIVANSGSVSLSYDGDRRASYLLLDDSKPTIRRVEYELDREVKALIGCGLPHSEWIGRTLQSASPQMP
jgi:predicted phosphodiesterase